MPPKRKSNANLDQLRALTRRQMISLEKLQQERDELAELVRIADKWFEDQRTCPSDWCRRQGKCQWCQRARKWTQDTE